MLHKILWFSIPGALALLAAAIGFDSRCLSSEEAAMTKGGVLLDNFACRAVATCDSFNYPLDAPCPKSLPCRTCDFATRNIRNCVQTSGAQCDWRSSRGSKCGRERIGLCTSSSFCANLVWYGTSCSDGPLCAG